MANEPLFHVYAPLRCFCPCDHLGRRRPCGQDALYKRLDSGGRLEYICPDHARPGDRVITYPTIGLRVSAQCQILFSGTAWASDAAIDEALGRLREAVNAAGGVLSVNVASATLGAYEADPRAPTRKASPGRVD